ncbi:MAG: hypothetical protein J6T39_00950, partial [Clostridia bacterium]|nr:hypothetical protein [Clostridia bacterium]
MKLKSKNILLSFVTLILALFMCVAPILTSISHNITDYYVVAVDSDVDDDEEFDYGSDFGEIGIQNNNDHGEINNLINNLDNRNANANNAGNANANNNKGGFAGMNPATQKAIVDYSMKVASSMNNMILDMIKNDGATDYPKYIIQMLRNGSAAAATAYFKSPAAGAAVDGVFEIVLSWFHYGETSQTELQIMQSKLNDQFNRLSREISEVKRDIAELSRKLDEKIENVLNKIDESFEAYYAKTQVTDFLYSTSGNFSYNLMRNYLYDAGQYSLYADLATALANQADDK